MDGLAALNAARIEAQTTIPLIQAATNVQNESVELKTPTSISVDTVKISPEAEALQAKKK